MGLFDFFKRRKAKKQLELNNKSFGLLVEETRKKIEALIQDKKWSSNREEMLEKIYDVLEASFLKAKAYTEHGYSMEDFIKQFSNINEVTDAITYYNQTMDERLLYNNISISAPFEEIYKQMLEIIDNYYKDKNGIKVFSRKEQFEIASNILKKYSEEDVILSSRIDRLSDLFTKIFFKKLIETKNPKEILSYYNEYVHEFLNDDVELEEQFRREFVGISTHIKVGDPKRMLLLRKIDCLRYLEDFDFKSIDDVPLYYDTSKEKTDEEKNAYIAREKLKKDKISASDLVFVRLTGVFPKDGVVEHIGEFSTPERLGTPFSRALSEKHPEIDSKKLDLLAPRFRWTSHWCINGTVSDHLYGHFSGKDYVIIEEVEQRMGDTNIIGDLVADTIMLGDTKLSKKARIVMTTEKYKELMSNSQTKRQLEGMNIVIVDGSKVDCVRLLLNDTERVWGYIGTASYAFGDTINSFERYGSVIDKWSDEEVLDYYLRKIQDALKNGEVEGLAHCIYGSEYLSISDIKDENPLQMVLRNKLILLHEATEEKIGIKDEKRRFNNSLIDLNSIVDNFYAVRTIENYLDFLDKRFPDLRISELTKNIKNDLLSGDTIRVNAIFDRFTDIDELISVTEEYNETVRQQYKIARAKKDQALLEKGLITQEQYDARISRRIHYYTNTG